MLIPKSKSNRIQILVLILAGLILQPAHASVIPGRWEKASNLKVDAPITVTWHLSENRGPILMQKKRSFPLWALEPE